MSTTHRPPKALRRTHLDEEDLDGSGGITELEKFEPERVDGVSQPANGFPVLLMKGLGSGTAAEEDVMPEDDIIKDDGKDPDDGAPGDDVDGSGDSHEDDDDDVKDCVKEEDTPAEVADPPAPSGEAVKAARQEYETARRDYLAAEPGLKGTDTPTELLKARAEWNAWNTLGKDEGLDGSEVGREKWVAKRLAEQAPVEDAPGAEVAPDVTDGAEGDLEKRDFDANVGGGVDRDKLPDSDFAGKHRSFPIVTQADVSDALQSVGRAGADNYSADTLRSNIASIARRKGLKVPESASKADGSGDSDMPPGKKACPTCKGKKTIKDGNMKCPACKGKGFMGPKAAAKAAGVAAVQVALDAGAITKEQAEDLLEQITAKSSRPLPSSVEPVAPHREPDGTSTVEQLEPEAGLGTDADSTADKVPVSVSSLTMKDAPYVVKRAHDAFCAAYSGADVLEEYPAMKGVADAAADAGTWFAGLAAKAVESGDVTETADLAALVKAAEAVGSFDPAAVEDGRALLHKSFTQMYPTEHISPKSMPGPGSFQRPYLSSGHAAESAGDWTVNIPKPTAVPKAEDFQRGALTAGHQTPSPGDHGPNNTAGPGASQYYTMSQKDMAMAAMRSMHDHIAATFAGCCPMAPSRTEMPPGMGATNAPSTAMPHQMGGISTVGKGEGAVDTETLQAVIEKAVRKYARKMTAATPDAAGIDPAAMQNMIAEQLAAATGPLNSEIERLRKEIDELGSQPDPAMAPVRGQMAKRPAEGTAAPVEKRSLIEEARDRQTAQVIKEQADFNAYLRMQAASSDPKVRERAEDLLHEREVAGARA